MFKFLCKWLGHSWKPASDADTGWYTNDKGKDIVICTKNICQRCHAITGWRELEAACD